MKEFQDYQNELNRCSKCGLCESVCPLFKLVPNDCVASRGKFVMLYGVASGELSLTKNINKYVDMCLKCGKCKDFCPAGIDVTEILAAAKHEYMKDKLSGKLINLIESPQVFDKVINYAESLSKPFRPSVSKKTCGLGSESVEKITTVVYFKGCINKIFPNTDIYLSKIFRDSPVEIIEPDFKCCGLPFLSEGNIERFYDVMQHNLMEMEKHRYDYVVTDCASCGSIIASYGRYTGSNTAVQNNINWGDLIAKYDIKFRFKKKLRVTFHKPCHLNNDDFFEKIIANCENINYIKMNEYDSCCGISGSFAIKNRKLSQALLRQKTDNIKASNADIVITTCPACLLGLKVGLAGTKIKAVSLPEFLAFADVY